MPEPNPLTPEQFVREVENVLPISIPSEQKRLLEHARAWAVSSYNGAVPEVLHQQLKTLEERYGHA
jgi:hypothetical protein